MSKTMPALDRRVKKTRRVIRDVLISLINEKGFESITVQEITERADINRSTFYFHYLDKYDLLNQCLDDMLKEFSDALLLQEVPNDEPCPVSRNGSLRGHFEHIAENAFFYKVMLGEKGVPGFSRRMKLAIEEAFYRNLDLSSPDRQAPAIPRDILCRHVASAHFGVIECWLENDLSYSAAYMSEILRQLVKIGPLNAAGILQSDGEA